MRTRSHLPKPTKGFTLLEVLLVLALLALVSTLVIANFDAIFRGFQGEPIEDTVQKAVVEARYLAAYQKEAVFLEYNPGNATLQITNAFGDLFEEIPTKIDPATLEITFFPIRPQNGSTALTPDTLTPISRIAFHPDSSSQPAAIQIEQDGEISTLIFDSFSNARLNETAEI